MKKNGYIITYTIITISFVLIMVTVLTRTILNEIDIAQSEQQSLKAFYAADTGIECARHYQSEEDAFDTTSEKKTYDCGVGTFEAGRENPPEECEAEEYNFTLDGFNNGACTELEVTVTPREVDMGEETKKVCDVRVVSSGKDSCTASDPVERTRWENI
jgi:hypothetical protein